MEVASLNCFRHLHIHGQCCIEMNSERFDTWTDLDIGSTNLYRTVLLTAIQLLSRTEDNGFSLAGVQLKSVQKEPMGD